MKQITVSVIDPVGLHARPATVAANSEVTISCNGDDEDAAIAAIEEVVRAQKIIG